MAKCIINVVIILILAALFIFPATFLCKLSDEIISVTGQTADLVQQNDWEAAQKNMEALNKKFRLSKDALELFLDHAAVIQMDADMRACLQLIHIHDDAQTLMELEFIIANSRHMKEIEFFNWSTLL